MNNTIKSILAAGCLLSLTACNDNSWNNRLDGFEDSAFTAVKSIDYTLTAADYKAIASNSANKLLAEGHEKALAAVGTQGCFNSEISAADYVPAFLGSSSFEYFTLDDGSAVRLTYMTAGQLPEAVKGIAASEQYTVSDEDYQAVWGSNTDYTPAFTPLHQAQASLPGVLAAAYPNAVKGDYVVVNYNTSDTDPVFTQAPGPDTPTFTASSVINTVAVGQSCDINGVVTAVSTNGFVLTDASGSIFVYMGNNFSNPDCKVGAQVVCHAEISSYNKGLQVSGSASTFEYVGTESYTYPAAIDLNKAKCEEIVARTTDAAAVYGVMTGTLKVTEKNINIEIGSDKAQGSAYYTPQQLKDKFVDGAKVKVYGYVIAVAGGKYLSMVVTDVVAASERPRRVVAVPSSNVSAAYTFDGTAWQADTDIAVLSAADYAAMGQKYGNLTEPDAYLPTYLKLAKPYAKAGDEQLVAYKYYASGTTSYRCDLYTFNGSEWTLSDGSVEETAQFVRTGGRWIYDPNVTITLPAGRNQELSTLYYQACVDWVYEHIDKPLGSTSITSGVGYVTKYGNNDYYTGASAYQGNLDLRADKAIAQYAAGYAGMTDAEIVSLMKHRFTHEVMPAVLAQFYPDVAPIDGLTILYTINFSAYDGTATTEYTVVYEVTGRAQFTFQSCTWDE